MSPVLGMKRRRRASGAEVGEEPGERQQGQFSTRRPWTFCSAAASAPGPPSGVTFQPSRHGCAGTLVAVCLPAFTLPALPGGELWARRV